MRINEDARVDELAQLVLAEVQAERSAEISVREELMFIRASLAWWRYTWRDHWRSLIAGFALGLLIANAVLGALGYWWTIGIAIALMLTELLLLSPWVERQRTEIYAAAALTEGLRHLHGWRRRR